MKLQSAIGSIAILTAACLGQPAHRIPFASQGNVLELSVRNASKVNSDRLTVSVKSAPEWLIFASSDVGLDHVAPGDATPAEFHFSVQPSASIGQAQNVVFEVTDASGAAWTKEVAVEIEAPQRFELSECYPNPFNPATSVMFDLPEVSQVWLRVYDLLGREVALLAEGDLPPGRHQQTWNASALSSGPYVIVLEARSEAGASWRSERKAILTK